MPAEGKNFLQSRLFASLVAVLSVSVLAVSIFFGVSSLVPTASEIEEFSVWAAAVSVEPVVTGAGVDSPAVPAMLLGSMLASVDGLASAVSVLAFDSLLASCEFDFDFLLVTFFSELPLSRREERSFLRWRYSRAS